MLQIYHFKFKTFSFGDYIAAKLSHKPNKINAIQTYKQIEHMFVDFIFY